MLMFDPNSVRKKVKMILALKKCPYFKNVSLNVTNYLNVVFHVTDIKLRIQPSADYALGDPEDTANIYCKSRNIPNKDTQN